MEGDAAPGAAEAAGRRDGGRAPESPGSLGSARGWGLACQLGNGRLSQIGALPPHGEGGGCLLPFFRKKNLSLLLLLLSHVKLFISAAVGAADGGG